MNEMSLSPDAAFRTPGRTVLQATGLTKRFHEGRDLDLTVLRGIDLDIRAGETVANWALRVRWRGTSIMSA